MLKFAVRHGIDQLPKPSSSISRGDGKTAQWQAQVSPRAEALKEFMASINNQQAAKTRASPELDSFFGLLEVH